MKNTGIYFKNIEQVDCILEIRLSMVMWDKIKRVSAIQNKSYSWVVRYSLFRLIKRKNIRQYIMSYKGPKDRVKFPGDDSYETLHEKVLRQRHGSSAKHRHRLCLYGEDELYVRISAARLGCTMTHLVRLALEKHLDSLTISHSKFKLNRFRQAALYWLGIKAHYGVEFPNIDISILCFQFLRYEKIEYW